MTRRDPHPSALRRLLLAALALVVAGCGWFEDPRPDRARAVVSGDGEVPVRIVYSKLFVAGRDEVGQVQVELIEADTVETELPWEQTFDIREERQFFAQVSAADSTEAITTRLRVFLDDDLRYDQERDLLESALQFLYQINRPIATHVEVL